MTGYHLSPTLQVFMFTPVPRAPWSLGWCRCLFFCLSVVSSFPCWSTPDFWHLVNPWVHVHPLISDTWRLPSAWQTGGLMWGQGSTCRKDVRWGLEAGWRKRVRGKLRAVSGHQLPLCPQSSAVTSPFCPFRHRTLHFPPLLLPLVYCQQPLGSKSIDCFIKAVLWTHGQCSLDTDTLLVWDPSSLVVLKLILWIATDSWARRIKMDYPGQSLKKSCTL